VLVGFSRIELRFGGTEFRYQNPIHPLTWFSRASESICLDYLGSVWLTSSPFVLPLHVDPRVFGI
jgi:hypothetical protein